MQKLTNINLTKLKKCNQIWEKMTPDEKGRTCQKCQNSIIDFRALPKNEIAEIHTFSEGKVCGLYTKEQLKLSRNRGPKLSKLKGLAAGIVGLSALVNVNAQVGAEPIESIQTEPKYMDENKLQSKQERQQIAVKDTVFISGKLMEESGAPAIFANIYIQGTKIGTTANIEGIYFLKVPKVFDSLNNITLIYSHMGSQTYTIEIGKEDLNGVKNTTIDVAFKDADMSGLDFYVYEKLPLHRRIWNDIKGVFTRKY